MTTSRRRRLALEALAAGLTLLLVPVGLTALGGPADAVTTYTWNDDPAVDGFGDHDWSKPTNWLPQGVPQDGDSVVVSGDWYVREIPDIELANLTVTNPGGLTELHGGTITVTESLRVAGSVVAYVDLVVDQGAVGDVLLRYDEDCGAGATLCTALAGDSTMTVEGRLNLRGSADDSQLHLSGNSDVRVAPGGLLTSIGEPAIGSGACCGAGMSTLRNEGRVVVSGPRLTLRNLAFDNAGRVTVGSGRELLHRGGPWRSSGATYAGGGHLQWNASGGLNPVASTTGGMDGGFEFRGTTTLADDTTVQFGRLSTSGEARFLTGKGTITGTGRLLLSGGLVYGDLVTGPGVRVETATGTTSTLQPWPNDPTLPGYAGRLDVRGSASVVGESHLDLSRGSRLTLSGTGSMRLRAGAHIDTPICCGDHQGSIVVGRDARLVVGDATGGANTFVDGVWVGGPGTVEFDGPVSWTPVGTRFQSGSLITGSGLVQGNLDVQTATVDPTGPLSVTDWFMAAPGGTLVTRLGGTTARPVVTNPLDVGGTATLPGRLVTTGPGDMLSPPRRELTILTAGSVVRRFACVDAPGWLASYTPTAVGLRSIGVTGPGCLSTATRRLLAEKVVGTRSLDPGVPDVATHTLLRVGVSHATTATSVRLSTPGGTRVIPVGPGETVERYVVLPHDPSQPQIAVAVDSGSVRLIIDRVGFYRPE